jgi:hypothetical protein
VSRYSAHDGYWLFGYLVTGPAFDVDLLAPTVDDGSPRGDAACIARARFVDQLQKAGVDLVKVAGASLRVEPLIEMEQVIVNQELAKGRALRVAVMVETTTGRRSLVRSTTIFAAPHDPRRESRARQSTAADCPGE